MAIGADVNGAMSRVREQTSSPGSVQSDWQILYDDATTASGSFDHLYPSGLDDSVAHRVVVPQGATRVLVRAGYDAGADTFTTQPVIRLTGVDNGGVPMRLDRDDGDANGAGVTLTCELVTGVAATGVVAGTDTAFSNVSSMDGYDLKGSKYLYVTVATAADIEDGGVALEVPIYGLFLN